MSTVWRNFPRGWRERLALRLLGDTPVMINVSLDDVGVVHAEREILTGGRLRLTDAYFAADDAPVGDVALVPDALRGSAREAPKPGRLA